eukprot:TRINITY_DN3706_c0_g2_i1.p1 TRINITY_DN3706_c0_g2~~TRINITY_DN3706_c0_g2_i1.p1  ORF type:complete len:713 (-),score=249.77 TRINITY_DN3706_c0_g2_i1:26-2164(-)
MSLAPLWNLLKKKRSFDRHAPEVPVLVSACCDYLEQNALVTEGIFRVSARKDEIVKLRKRFDSGRYDLKDVDPYVVACVLKAFFLEAEQPLLTFELYPAFLQAAVVDEEADQLRCLRSVVEQIPAGSKKTVSRLMALLKSIAAPEHSKLSKMTASNLAIVFAPGLLRKKKQDLADMLSDSPTCNRVIELLIRNYDELFGEKLLHRDSTSSFDVNDPTVKTFYQTLRLGTLKITKMRLLEDYIQGESESSEDSESSAGRESQRTQRKERRSEKVRVSDIFNTPRDDEATSDSGDLPNAVPGSPVPQKALSAAEELANSLEFDSPSHTLASDDSVGSTSSDADLRGLVDPLVAKHLDLLDYLSTETLDNLAATISSVHGSDSPADGIVIHEMDFSPLADPARMRTPEVSSNHLLRPSASASASGGHPTMSTPLSKAGNSSRAAVPSVPPDSTERPTTPGGSAMPYSRRKQDLVDLVQTAQHALNSRPSSPATHLSPAYSPSATGSDSPPLPASPMRSPMRSPLPPRSAPRQDAAPAAPAATHEPQERGDDFDADGLPRSGSMIFSPVPDDVVDGDDGELPIVTDENASELLHHLEAALLHLPEQPEPDEPHKVVEAFVARTSRLDRLKRRQSFGQALSLLSSLQHEIEANLEADDDFAAEWQRRLAFRNTSNSIRFPGDPTDTSSFSSQASESAGPFDPTVDESTDSISRLLPY